MPDVDMICTSSGLSMYIFPPDDSSEMLPMASIFKATS